MCGQSIAMWSQHLRIISYKKGTNYFLVFLYAYCFLSCHELVYISCVIFFLLLLHRMLGLFFLFTTDIGSVWSPIYLMSRVQINSIQSRIGFSFLPPAELVFSLIVLWLRIYIDIQYLLLLLCFIFVQFFCFVFFSVCFGSFFVCVCGGGWGRWIRQRRGVWDCLLTLPNLPVGDGMVSW